MKIWNIFVIVALGLSLVSCSDDEPKTPLEDKAGMVFLDNGEYVTATTDFSDEDAVAVLCSKRWCRSGMPYIYDEYNIQRLYKESGNSSNSNSNFKFNADGYYRSLSGEEDVYGDAKISTFEVTDKCLIMKDCMIQHNEATTFTYKYTLVSVDENRIIMDGVYDSSAWEIPDGFMSFDKSTASVRYVWVPYEAE